MLHLQLVTQCRFGLIVYEYGSVTEASYRENWQFDAEELFATDRACFLAGLYSVVQDWSFYTQQKKLHFFPVIALIRSYKVSQTGEIFQMFLVPFPYFQWLLLNPPRSTHNEQIWMYLHQELEVRVRFRW